MADFKRSGVKRFYDKRESGFNRQDTGRPAFAQKKWDGPSRPVTMHKAICAKCGHTCEVPFRPFEGRAIYCKDCFQGKNGTEDRSYNKFPQKNYNDNKNFAKPDFKNNSGNEDGNDLKNQLGILTAKIDRLIKAVETIANIEPAAPEIEPDGTIKTSPVTRVRKAGKKVFKKNKRPF